MNTTRICVSVSHQTCHQSSIRACRVNAKRCVFPVNGSLASSEPIRIFRKRRDRNRILSVAHAIRFHISGTSSWSMWMVWPHCLRAFVPLLVFRRELRRPDEPRIGGGYLPASRIASRIQDRLCRSAGQSREWASFRSSGDTSSPGAHHGPTPGAHLRSLNSNPPALRTDFQKTLGVPSVRYDKACGGYNRDPASVSFLVMV